MDVLRRRLGAISVILAVVASCVSQERENRAKVTGSDVKMERNNASSDDFLKFWVSDSIVSAVVKIYLKLFQFLTESNADDLLDVGNDLIG